ncbi:MAG TPA: ion channel [Kofleriaceae bacterium]
MPTSTPPPPTMSARDLPRRARRTEQHGSTFYVIGDSRAHFFRDIYHFYLKMPWSLALTLFTASFFAINLLFALAYYLVGGVGGADGTFFDALSFSVQTFGTIGYGKLYPDGVGAEWLMMAEAISSTVITALATGLIFSKFARPTTRVRFSRCAVITDHDGQRTLIFRVGNRRSNVIVEATIHVVAVFTTTTAEGKVFYKAVDLPMVRDRQVGMTRGWTLMHEITPESPLHDMTTDKLRDLELELYIALTGIDDVSVQTVHATHRYNDGDIRIDHHLADTLIPLETGEFVVDLTRFDEVVPDGVAERPMTGRA